MADTALLSSTSTMNSHVLNGGIGADSVYQINDSGASTLATTSFCEPRRSSSSSDYDDDDNDNEDNGGAGSSVSVSVSVSECRTNETTLLSALTIGDENETETETARCHSADSAATSVTQLSSLSSSDLMRSGAGSGSGSGSGGGDADDNQSVDSDQTAADNGLAADAASSQQCTADEAAATAAAATAAATDEQEASTTPRGSGQQPPLSASAGITSLKRAQLKRLIYDLYDLSAALSSDTAPNAAHQKEAAAASVLVEGYLDKLPPGKTLKNSLLLTWRRLYFRLSSTGVLRVHDIDKHTLAPTDEPVELYNLMGGRVDYDQNHVIHLDDNRGNVLVVRCVAPPPLPLTNSFNSSSNNNNNNNNNRSIESADEMFRKWRAAFDSQIVDRSDSLWIRPGQLLVAPLQHGRAASVKQAGSLNDKRVLIIDIGSCSVRAGVFANETSLPALFMPTVCSRDSNRNKLNVGFDAFDSLLGSAAPSTIDMRKSVSSYSLNLTSNCPLIFPFSAKGAIDKHTYDIESVDAIIGYAVDALGIVCAHYHVLLVTANKLTDRVNVQLLNLLLESSSGCDVGGKFGFCGATIINQTLLNLYAYNATVGVVANLGEKIDIVPICNGVAFQNGVTNLAYGGATMSAFLNSYISRGHVNYVNDIEQYLVRYVKEKSCYVALNYADELAKCSSSRSMHTVTIEGDTSSERKSIEIPEAARFTAVEGLFNPEIWGIDGQGIHKLIFKAIQSASMDLRKEMARSIYLSGGMSQLPGLRERLEKELRLLVPPALQVKVNRAPHSYHSAFLGAYRFVQQPEYERLLITREQWATEGAACLRQWRMI